MGKWNLKQIQKLADYINIYICVVEDFANTNYNGVVFYLLCTFNSLLTMYIIEKLKQNEHH